jgi:hypothetical protein
MNIIKIVFAVLIGFSLNSFSEDFPGISNDKFKESDISLPAPQKGIIDDIANGVSNVINNSLIKNPVRDITIMVFMNGKNNLEEMALFNLNDMERVGSTDKVNIIAETGRRYINLDGKWEQGVRRFYIQKDTDTEQLHSKIVFRADSYDMGDYKRAIEFVKWTKEKFPARRYILILWDHGSGWLDPRKKQKQPNKGISFDDETGNYINTEEIGKIVRESGGVDILAFDACLMQMAEVLTEVKDHTKIVIGSEETVPGYGYPYGLFLDPIVKNPSMSNEEISKTIVSSFKKFYDFVKQPATLSAVRSSKISGLNRVISDFAKAAMTADEIEAVKKARTDVIRFDIVGEEDDPNKKISFFGDIYNFADIIAKNISKNDEKSLNLKMKADILKSFITDQLVIARGNSGQERTGKSLDLAYGVSVYIAPVETKITIEKIDSILKAPYSNFKFAKETAWGDFVKFMYEKAK